MPKAADFRKTHDQSFIVPEKIKKGLAALGTDTWEYEVDFNKRCGLGPSQIGKYREQFGEHVVALHRSKSQRHQHAWAGSAKLAKELREMLS